MNRRLNDTVAHKDQQLLNYISNGMDKAGSRLGHNELLRQNEKIQKLINDNKEMSHAIEGLAAENACLRQLSKVPDNFGEQLEIYKKKQKDNAVFYKHNNDVLMKDIERLEKEKTMLEYELRKWRIAHSGAFDFMEGLSDDQKQAVQNWIINLKHGKQEIPLTEKSEMLKAEIMRLQDKIAVYEEVIGKNKDGYVHEQTHAESAQVKQLVGAIQEQKNDIHNLYDTIKNLVEKGGVTQNSGLGQVQGQSQIAGSQINATINNINRPPRPIPGVFGDWTEVSEGMSYKFGSRLPVRTYDEELANMDLNKAKYYIAALQLHNMESMELLHQREKEFEAVNNEIQELRTALRHALLVEDELFVKHHFELNNFEGKVSEMKKENFDLRTDCIQATKRCEIFEASFAAIQSKNPSGIEARLSEMTKTAAIAETNIVKLSRKYDALEAEYYQMMSARQASEKDKYEREYLMTEKLNSLLAWKGDATEKIKILLERLNNSVSMEEHNHLKTEFELERQKYTALKANENVMREQNIKLQGAEREMQENASRASKLEEEVAAIEAEYAVIHMRLCALDKVYERHGNIFKNIANILKERNISPLQYFQAIDLNRDGSLSAEEFGKALDSMGVALGQGELESFFTFMDIDNSGQLDYTEFCRKLRRYGVVLRSPQEELVNKLWNAIMKLGMTLEQAYKAFDIKGTMELNFADMSLAFKQLDVEIDSKTAAEFFKLVDVTGNGRISCAEFVHVFSRYNKNQRNSVYAQKTSNWKIDLMAQLDNICREKKVTIEQIFSDIDEDQDSRVTFAEFRKMFLKMNLAIEQKALQQLFAEIDGNRSGIITQTEFIAYVNNAKRESDRIKRMQAFERSLVDRGASKESGTLHDSELQDAYDNPLTSFKVKVSLLENRQRLLKSQNESLINRLTTMEEQRSDLESKLKVENESLANVSQQLIIEKERCAALERRVESSMTKEQAALTRASNENLRIENTQLRSALETFRNLHDAAVREAKSLSLSVGKNEDEIMHLRKQIRELQSISDENSLIGKLYNQILTEKWKEATVNRKYDQIIDELRKAQTLASNLEAKLNKKESEMFDMQTAAADKINLLEKQLFEAKMSILPNISIAKIEELNLALKRIGNQKLELEITNKQLRNDSYETQVRLDHYILREKNLLDLEQLLKNKHPDELSLKVIELSEKLSSYKLDALKAQREASLVKEREEYYMRINKTQTDQIVSLEEQVARNDEKFIQRENFWRDRHQEQLKLLSRIPESDSNKKLSSKLSSEEIKARMRDGANSLEGKDRDSMTNIPQMNLKGSMMSMSALDVNNQILKDQVTCLQDDIRLRDLKIEELKRQIEHKQVGVNYRTDNIDTMVVSDLENKTREIAQAAQHTVMTLQQMLEEKSHLVAEKEKKIDMLRNDLSDKAKELSRVELENENLRRQISVGERNRMSVEQVTAIRTIEKLAKMDAKEIEKMVVNYEQKLQILAEQLTEAEKVNKDLLHKLRVSRGEKASLENAKTTEANLQDIDRTKKDLAEMTELYKKKALEVKRLNGVLSTYAKDLEDMKGEVTKNKVEESQKLIVAKNENGHYEEKISVLTSKFKTLQEDYSKDKKIIQDLKANEIRYRQQIGELNEQINKLTAMNAKLKDDNSKLGAKKLVTQPSPTQTLPSVGNSAARRPSASIKPQSPAPVTGSQEPPLINLSEFKETMSKILHDELVQTRAENERLKRENEVFKHHAGSDLVRVLSETQTKELDELRDQNSRLKFECQLLRNVIEAGIPQTRQSGVKPKSGISTQGQQSDPLTDALINSCQKQISSLKDENIRLSNEAASLRQKFAFSNGANEFLDEDGNLSDGDNMSFGSREALVGAFQKYLNSVGKGMNLFTIMKQADPSCLGSAPVESVIAALEKAGMKFKSRDKSLFIPQYVPKTPSGQMDYPAFFDMVKGQQTTGTMTAGHQGPTAFTGSVGPSAGVGFGRQLPLGVEQPPASNQVQPQGSIKMHSAVLDRNVDLLKKKLLEKEKEVADLTKQLKAWKQTALGYENELKDKNNSSRYNSMSMNATLQAKLGKEGDKLKQIQDLENQIRSLKSEIKYEVDKREQSIKELQEDLTKRTYDMSIAQSESNNLRSQLDRVLNSKLQKDQLWEEKEKEKDLLVSSLMERLEKSRKQEEEIRIKLRAIEKENIDLKHAKDGIDTRIEHLNREIRELKDRRQVE
jgi:Ca2+-binding EF-hand superfamily protein/chromosome segregation ATPase